MCFLWAHAQHLHTVHIFLRWVSLNIDILNTSTWVGKMFIIAPEATFPTERRSWKVELFLHFLHHSFSGPKPFIFLHRFLWFPRLVKAELKAPFIVRRRCWRNKRNCKTSFAYYLLIIFFQKTLVLPFHAFLILNKMIILCYDCWRLKDLSHSSYCLLSSMKIKSQRIRSFTELKQQHRRNCKTILFKEIWKP